ncbi:ATP-binding protein [Parafrankia sp. Ea1.12]|uniref:NACHT domain-containing protein n=1 Tax=Parafrankia sp. Ea1.12 TaxID=573499 RepID=UPI0011BD803E|nr:ATP-binding protein [Parafrankia sp. Ea1.12]
MGEKKFQQLCNTLLVAEFPDVTCFPVGQKDGGRDAVRKNAAGGGAIIYQVKWTGDRLRNPASWLTGALDGEADNIRRLVADGAQGYYLMTCVAGTSQYKSGTMAQLDEELDKRSKLFGIPMTCWWQADIDARVDKAPIEVKWAYPDMLAGPDLIRYMIEADRNAARDDGLRTLLLKVVAAQWDEDAKVKFKQVELDSRDLVDLFVDVEANRIYGPQAYHPEALGGAAEYLLATPARRTLVRGEPGQGKSTLGQYLCQAHRAQFLPAEDGLGRKRPDLVPDHPRFPIRIDLRDYAQWVGGVDPFADPPAAPNAKPRRPKSPSLEGFVAHLLHVRSGWRSVTVEMVQDILSRLPVLIVLDGLDEIARDVDRVWVVKQIDELVARTVTGQFAPQVIVTTRPNASDLAEPSPTTFEIISLVRLSPALRTAYLRKWADARSIRAQDRRALQRTFDSRSAEPHIAQLADNPMQLTILLYLMQKRGDSVPTGRTDLYRSYMETFLDREAAKSRAVHTHRKDLEEVTAFLGWNLQSLAETQGTNGQMATKAIRKSINGYLFDTGKDTTLVDDLFTAVTDRVWALTSKVQGTFEFDVQPVREFFAARYLYEFAEGTHRTVLRSTVLAHLIRRPYWLNTSRFYAGFATPNEIAGLLEGIEEELEAGRHPAQVRMALWALLVDGVFAVRPKTQRRATALLGDDLSVRLLTRALPIDASPDLLAPDRGAVPLADALLVGAAATPAAHLSVERVDLALRMVPDQARFDAWWLPRMTTALGTADEVAWLRLGVPANAAERLPADLAAQLRLDGVDAAQVALDAGLSAPAGSDLEGRLVRSVLDGLCSEVATPASGLAGDLLRLFAPQHFIRRSRDTDIAYVITVGHVDEPIAEQRHAVLKRLRTREAAYDRVQAALRFNRGQAGTTSPWGNTARELCAMFGPCWLAAEIAIIGAASSDIKWRTGGNLTRDSQPFGPLPDYGRLLTSVRFNRSRPAWWHEQYDAHDEPLSRGTWALAMLAAAQEHVVLDSLDRLDDAVRALPEAALQALAMSSSRLAASGVSRRLNTELISAVAPASPETALLLAHHVGDLTQPLDLAPLSAESLGKLGRFGVAAWPATRALTVRLIKAPSADLVDLLGTHGPAAIVDVDAAADSIPVDLMRSMIEKPHRYPWSWLRTAERCISRTSSEPHLAAVADSDHWFAE